MPLDPAFVTSQVDQFKLELVDIADVFAPTELTNPGGEPYNTFDKNPTFSVPCLFLGSGGSAQERQIAAKTEAPVVASILIAEPDTPDNVILPPYRVLVTTPKGTTHGPYEVLAPPVPRAYNISYRVVLGSV